MRTLSKDREHLPDIIRIRFKQDMILDGKDITAEIRSPGEPEEVMHVGSLGQIALLLKEEGYRYVQGSNALYTKNA